MTASAPETGLQQLFYVSRALAQPQEIEPLLQQARARNPQRGLSGALLYSGGHFAQWLEGPAEALDALLPRLHADVRHEALRELWRAPAAQRRFEHWSMAFVGSPGADDLIAQLLQEADPSAMSAARVERLLGLLLAAAEPAA